MGPKGNWLRRLFVAAGLLVGAGALALVALVVYVSLISVTIDKRIEQLRSTRSSRIFARFPPLTPGRALGASEWEALLRQAGLPARESPADLAAGGFVWTERGGERSSLLLVRPPFDGAGSPLEKRGFRIDFVPDRGWLRIDEMTRSDGGDAVESVELPPKPLGMFFAGRIRSQFSVALSDIPVSVRLAVMAIEDKDFLDHVGVSVRGTLRALWKDIRERRFAQGGSTITQQLMKNLFFSREKALSRKIKEALYAFVTEARHSKETILEAYLNEVYLGQWNTHEIHGVAEASRYYFNKSIFDLALHESALLAAIIQAPALYNPHRHADRALKRRNLVLEKMLAAGFILQPEYETAIKLPLGVAAPDAAIDDAAYFMDLVMQSLPPDVAERMDTDALTLYVTMNPYLQSSASRLLSSHLERLEKSYKSLADRRKQGVPLQAALIAVDVRSCSVVALQGGRNFREAPFNRALQGKRQPGSLFKPFVFLAAFDERAGDARLAPDSVIQDEPFEWAYDKQTWSPRNYDEQFRGQVTAAEALQKSLNVPTARVAQAVGIGPIADSLVWAGIRSPLPRVPSLSLGSAEVTPFEMTEAYVTLARLGERCPLRAFTQVFDENRNLVLEQPANPVGRLDRDASAAVVGVLKGVFTQGTAAWASGQGIPLENFAGKTGTTNDYMDAWFVGFSPDILALVWVGYDQKEKVGLTGSSAALPAWVDFMRLAGPFYGGEDFAL